MIVILCWELIVNILPVMAVEDDVKLPELCSAANDFCPRGYYCSTTSYRCWPCHRCGEDDIILGNTPTKCLCDGGKDGDPYLICSSFPYPGHNRRGRLIHTDEDLSEDIRLRYAYKFDGKYAERNPSKCPNMATTTVSTTTGVTASTGGPIAFSSDKKSCGDPGQPEHGYQIISKYSERVKFVCDDGYTIKGTSTLYCLKNGSWSADNPICKLGSNQSQPWVTQDRRIILPVVVVCLVFIPLITISLVCYGRRCCIKPDRTLNERDEIQREPEDDTTRYQNGASQFHPMLSNGIIPEVEGVEELPMTFIHDTEFSNEILTEDTWTRMKPLLQTAFEDEKFKRALLVWWLPEASEKKHVLLNICPESDVCQAIKEETEIFGVNTYKALGNALQSRDLQEKFTSQHNNIQQLINVLTNNDSNTQVYATCSYRQEQEMESIA